MSSVPFLPHRQPVIVPISIPSPAAPLTKLANVLARLRYALSECISMPPLHALPVQTYTWGQLIIGLKGPFLSLYGTFRKRFQKANSGYT